MESFTVVVLPRNGGWSHKALAVRAINSSARATGTASGRWRVSGGAVYQGARYADFANAMRIPGYTRMDLGANYREVGWSATLAVENVLNRRYYASGVENRPAVIYPGAPRSVSLRLTMKF